MPNPELVEPIVTNESKETIVSPFSKNDILKIVKDSFLVPCRYVVNNIKKVDGEILEKAKCGDVIVKRTIEGDKVLYHAYIVSHKQATGICLTYTAAGYIETQSYDKIEGVWTYNSEDKWTE